MKLSLENIKEITMGAERIKEEDGLIRFYRFTETEEEHYKARNTDYYHKTFAPAGIKLSFKTDSRRLFLSGEVARATTRSYYSFDVFVNGEVLGHIDNFSDKEIPDNYALMPLDLGKFSKEFDLGEGEKTVTVYMPWSVKVALSEISLDDGATCIGVKPDKTILVLGDSITQGYDVLRPSNAYSVKLCELLCAEGINKAIGGDGFFPEFLKTVENTSPDYITVAYGTNDWSALPKKVFEDNCRDYYKMLGEKFPQSKIFAITPIWRKSMNEEKPVGKFSYVEEYIREITKDIDNIEVISGFMFVPHDESFYGDLILHPNDKGFECYFNNLKNEIMKYL